MDDELQIRTDIPEQSSGTKLKDERTGLSSR